MDWCRRWGEIKAERLTHGVAGITVRAQDWKSLSSCNALVGETLADQCIINKRPEGQSDKNVTSNHSPS